MARAAGVAVEGEPRGPGMGRGAEGSLWILGAWDGRSEGGDRRHKEINSQFGRSPTLTAPRGHGFLR